MPDQPPMIAGRYTELRLLGTGGMGSVVLARDERLRREVAIKRVHAGGGVDAARRIGREAKLGAGLSHPGLVTIYDTLVENANLVIVMEYVEGETLAARLTRGRLAPAEALAVLRPVAAALDHAHASGIVHRDVKPANVLLGGRGVVKLADLGVALAAENEDLSRITRDGALIGSLPYMAPEQLGPARATAAADVYALAAIAYEMLSGQRARQGSTPLQLARAAEEDPAPDLSAIAPDLPRAAAAVLSAGMAREPDARPASAGMLIGDLEVALAHETAPVVLPPPAAAAEPSITRRIEPPPPREPSHRRRTPALAGLLALLAAGVALVVVLSSGGDDPSTQQAQAPTETTPTAAGEPTSSPESPEAVVPASDDPSTPTGAVRAFYELAAEDDFDASWALAGPAMRAAFGDSQAAFEADLDSLESIRFKQLTAGAAEAGGTPVTVETVARHTDHTDRCTGDLLAVPDGSDGFLVDPAGVSCDSS